MSNITLTTTQIEDIEELRKRMVGKMEPFQTYDQNSVCYRFLKARNWDLNKAEVMLNKSIQYRNKMNVEWIIADYQPSIVLEKFVSNVFICDDKEGCQVVYSPIGKYDVRGLLKAAKPSDIIKALIKVFNIQERLLEKRAQEKNKWSGGFVMIFDFTGMTLTNVTNRKGLEVVMEALRIMLENCPERLQSVYFINASPFCTWPLNIIMSLLPTETFKKFHIFAKDGWQEELLKIIDADQLPAFLGGIRTDPDGNPLCKTIVNQFGKVDESHYLTKKGNELTDQPGVKTLRVPRASTCKVHIPIKEPGSVIEWEFETETGDIGFGLWTEDQEAEGEVEVVSMERVDTKDFVESGIYICEAPGNYFILFDNTNSWLYSKEIFYRITIGKPQEIQLNLTDNSHSCI